MFMGIHSEHVWILNTYPLQSVDNTVFIRYLNLHKRLTNSKRRRDIMRRSDREITDRKAIEEIISRSKVCKLAMCEGGVPYIVPMCFGFKDNILYLHSAPKGKKIEILEKNPNVCFEFEILTQIIQSAKACKWGMKYKSVIGFGTAGFITDDDLKREAFDIIMNQYSDELFSYEEAPLRSARIIKVEIHSMTGKQSDI